MEYIVTEIIKTIKDSENAIEREMKLLHLFLQLFTQALTLAFEIIDAELAEQYKKEGYRVERRDARTIQGLFGTVTYRRRRMKKDGPRAKGFYPLDRQLGFAKYQRFTALFMKRVAEVASGSVYRTTADVINRLTLTTISHQTVGSIIKQVGKQYAAWEKQQANQECGTIELTVPSSSIVCIEGDGLLIKGQGAQQQEVHRLQVSEGSEQQGNRSVLLHPHFFASTDHQEVVQQATEYIQRTYDLEQVLVVSNSDGGSGYGTDVFAGMAVGAHHHEHVLDRYHVNRKLKERLYFAETDLQDAIRKALWKHQWESVQVLLDTAESVASCPEEQEHVRKLRKYLERNWNWLKPMRLRGLTCLPTGIGTCESNHRIYSYRMKRQGRNWSKQGGKAMVKVITAIKNHELDKAFIGQEKGYEESVSRKFHSTMRRIMKQAKFVPHVGIHQGSIRNNKAVSSAMGALAKSLAMPAIL